MEDDNPANLDDANKYRPFAFIENSILASLRQLISTTTESDIATTNTTQMAGALTLALSYINKATITYSDAGSSAKAATANVETADTPTGLQSRILVVSVSGDLAHQYIPIMNTTFAAQRLRIPIDILKLAGDTVFLQQASDATKGIYMQLRNAEGLLQYLMMAFLPDQMSRKHLVAPTQEVVDFRAACFCHRRVVDVGFVCSICLSSLPIPSLRMSILLIRVYSFLLSSRRSYMLDLLNTPHTWRLWRETGRGSPEEEEKAENEWWCRDWQWERNASPGRIVNEHIIVYTMKFISRIRKSPKADCHQTSEIMVIQTEY
jgi:transcription factor TFB4